jgi:hypothetical protein
VKATNATTNETTLATDSVSQDVQATKKITARQRYLFCMEENPPGKFKTFVTFKRTFGLVLFFAMMLAIGWCYVGGYALIYEWLEKTFGLSVLHFLAWFVSLPALFFVVRIISYFMRLIFRIHFPFFSLCSAIAFIFPVIVYMLLGAKPVIISVIPFVIFLVALTGARSWEDDDKRADKWHEQKFYKKLNAINDTDLLAAIAHESEDLRVRQHACKKLGHDFEGCKCKRCGEVRPQHDLGENCICKTCGEELHHFVLTGDACKDVKRSESITITTSTTNFICTRCNARKVFWITDIDVSCTTCNGTGVTSWWSSTGLVGEGDCPSCRNERSRSYGHGSITYKDGTHKNI